MGHIRIAAIAALLAACSAPLTLPGDGGETGDAPWAVTDSAPPLDAALAADGGTLEEPDAAGFDAAGFDAAGFDAAGFDAAGFDAAGFDAAGFDAAGFDAGGACVTPIPAVDVSAGGAFDAPWTPVPDAAMQYPLSWTCGAHTASGHEVMQAVFVLTLATARDVRVVVHDSSSVAFGLFDVCDPSRAMPLGCITGGPTDAVGVFRDVPPGTHVLAAQWIAFSDSPDPTSDLSIDVSYASPTPPPANDRCTGAVDLGSGGTFAGTLAGARVDYPSPLCSSERFADVAYRFTIGEPSDVEITVDDAHMVVIADDCTDPSATNRGCGSRWAVASGLSAGTYYVLVGNVRGVTSPGPDDFALTARIAPHAAPAGDRCAMPVAIAPGTPYAGDLFGGTDDLRAPPWVLGSPLYCHGAGYEGRTDVFHRLSIPARRHVEIDVDTAMSVNLSLARDCADLGTPGAELACNAGGLGGTGSLSLRDLAAGDYLVRMQVAAWSAVPPGPYVLDVHTHVPDSTCGAPVSSLSGAGSTTITGDTTDSFDDHRASACGAAAVGRDEVHTLTLTARSRVVVDASATAGAVAYVRSTCSVATSQVLCAAPTGAATLDPGEYYVIVDSTRVGGGAYSVTIDRIVL